MRSLQNLLLEHCGLFFVPLSLAVVNDDSARCKKMIALAIKSLLSQVDATHQNNMFALVTTWITGDKVRLASLSLRYRYCGTDFEDEMSLK